ncbi:putative lactonohydrolase [Aspergillus avenaceus]|uniref:Putative lactonohydrolase n=1 Tax=Aspergillus avenaceus TaxID=36643 RepID=A0A5N6TQT0_ASPAV|nr:putative lactonohydrolase [Aspergillus avenaceus]
MDLFNSTTLLINMKHIFAITVNTAIALGNGLQWHDDQHVILDSFHHSSKTAADSLVHKCIAPGVVCLENQAANLPYPFWRDSPNGTFVTNLADIKFQHGAKSTSWEQVRHADFVIFDEERGRKLLGESPSVDFVFPVNPWALHEAPVFVPGLNKIIFSELSPILEQFAIDLNVDPPTLSQFKADPPIYVPNGGFYHDGLIYYSTAGSSKKLKQRPGITTLDPWTNKSSTLLNNYYGLTFTDCDDVIVDPVTGFIWFTVPYYSWWLEVADTPPQLRSATYRFNPATGSTVVVNDEMRSPNGIAMSPDRRYIYITDTAAAGDSAPISLDIPSPGVMGILFNTTGLRTIYKFDLVDQGHAITNKRPIHYDAIGTVPDGLKVARNGWVVTATGNGLSVMDEYGDMIARVQTNFTVNNFVWSDANDYREVWMVGQGGVARVKWDLQGQKVA